MNLLKNSVLRLKMNTGKEVNMFIAVDGAKLYYIHGNGIKSIVNSPVNITYRQLLSNWLMAGVYPIKTTNYPMGSDIHWFSETYGLTVFLKCFYYRDRPDLGDASTQNIWQLSLSKPFEEINDVIDIDDSNEFYSFLTEGLHDYGLHNTTPFSSYSPTGLMFCEQSIRIMGKRALVYNNWALDC